MDLRQARAVIRKAKRRVPEGDDVNALNITSMMDMMTIILVFLLKSFSVSAAGITPDAKGTHFQLPSSTSPVPVKVVLNVTVTQESIIVEGFPVVAVKRGIANRAGQLPFFIDPSDKQDGAQGYVINPLLKELSDHVKRLKRIAELDPNQPFTGELLLVCDKDIPFRLVTEVLATAAQAGFGKYRLLAIKKEPVATTSGG